ncbi:hydroxyacid dehydrogenase [Candidatus Woesearchaeota archaeon]|nr:hydroxyacid dehydrogenase [Candidatus Woesearchaeota archaeon]
MRITFFEVQPNEKPFFTSKLVGHDLVFEKNPLGKRNAKKFKDTEAIAIFILSKITKDVLDQMPRLKFITTMSTGFDHIDLDACKKRDIKVSRVPVYGQNTVAEHAFGLLQALNRHIVEAVKRTREGNFSFQDLLGQDLVGKTMGIIGTGNIGEYMVRYAKVFGMRVVAYDAYKRADLAKKLGFFYVSLNELYKQSDFITLHVPLNDATRHLLNTQAFRKMKKGVIIINVGRGPLVDTKALIKALDSGKVRGAALDVLELESDLKNEAKLLGHLSNDKKRLLVLVENHELLHRKNVIVTPHLAFYTEQALQRILDITLVNLKGHITKRYKNKVCC